MMQPVTGDALWPVLQTENVYGNYIQKQRGAFGTKAN